MKKLSENKRLNITVLIIGLFPTIFIILKLINSAVMGTTGIALMPPYTYYYGFEAVVVDLSVIALVMMVFWFVTAPWIIFLIIIPIINLIKIKHNSNKM